MNKHAYKYYVDLQINGGVCELDAYLQAKQVKESPLGKG